MIRTLNTYTFLLLSFLLLLGCREEEPAGPSTERRIEYFAFEALDPVAEGEINHDDGTIKVTVPYGAELQELRPTIAVSEGATVSPASEQSQDFSDFVIYTVTAASGAKKSYTVLVSEGPSNNADLTAFSFSNLFLSGTIQEETKEITFEVPFGTDLSSLEAEIILQEEEATLAPAAGTAMDFSQPVEYTVTAPDGQTTNTYIVTVEVLPQETGVRGVWLTNVDSNVLNSQEKIQEAVDLMAELNINTVFVVTYNKASTTYPSQVMKNLTGEEIGPQYAGRDPLREFIDAAHARDIKVFAWFEYGFAAYHGSPGPILEAKPHWAAIDKDGNPVVKNGFHWLNSLLPEVQDFMSDLVMEVVTNYPDLDGIQGDDRLPAMPTIGGYDDYTVAQYEAEHNGQLPPNDPKEGNWVQWRANRLTNYAGELYQQVKELNPNSIVAMSPSPMNFGLVEYLQDYPAWVEKGYADIVSPQLYRRDRQGISIYRDLLRSQLALVGEENQDKFYPGLLSYLSGYSPDPAFMVNMIRENRKKGVMGEVHFFYNALLAQPEVFKAIYPAPAIYPNLLD